ncbi:transposase family protein [Streptomyces sp. NPDC052811]|uniref:helix-turn-helix domain-containing protein n=1 Tax=Streptomyces sp. NPDC052811 TaxID=3155731 RepID=UPI00341E50D6
MWHERHQAALVSRPRRRAVGAGAKHKLVFVDRLWATLIHLRHGATHDVLACWFAVDRCTITRAVGEVRPLLAERGCTIAPDIRLRTTPHIPSEGFARSCWGGSWNSLWRCPSWGSR